MFHDFHLQGWIVPGKTIVYTPMWLWPELEYRTLVFVITIFVGTGDNNILQEVKINITPYEECRHKWLTGMSL